MKIKATHIWFDKGNVLVLDPFPETLEKQAEKFELLFKKSGYEISRVRIVKAWKEANRKINYTNISHFFQEESIVCHALKSLGVKPEDIGFLSPQMLLIYRKGLKEAYTKNPRNREIAETFEFLRNRGKSLNVFSNERGYVLPTEMKWIGVEKYLDNTVASEDVCLSKPDPRVYEYMIKLSKTKPENIVYVGDEPERDIIPAKKFGLKTVLFIPPKPKEMSTFWRNYKIKSNPDAEIHEFSELKKTIV